MFVINSGCICCDLCRQVCPADSITLDDGGNMYNARYKIDPSTCTQCGNCVHVCPVDAVIVE